MEEPENGIHPGKMEAILGLLKDISVDPDQSVGTDNPLRQVIVATHSPVFVQIQDRDDLVFAARVKKRTRSGSVANILKCLPLAGSWRTKQHGGDFIGISTLIDYLQQPENARIQHEMDLDQK